MLTWSSLGQVEVHTTEDCTIAAFLGFGAKAMDLDINMVNIVPILSRYLKLHLNILASLRCHAMFKVFR